MVVFTRKVIVKTHLKTITEIQTRTHLTVLAHTNQQEECSHKTAFYSWREETRLHIWMLTLGRLSNFYWMRTGALNASQLSSCWFAISGMKEDVPRKDYQRESFLDR
jgi:hypothetical protein